MSTQHQMPASRRRNSAHDLTVRELDILRLAGMGLSMKSVGKALSISAGTVKWHLSNLYQKLGVASREEALQKARGMKLIESGLICQECARALITGNNAPAEHGALHH